MPAARVNPPVNDGRRVGGRFGPPAAESALFGLLRLGRGVVGARCGSGRDMVCGN